MDESLFGKIQVQAVQTVLILVVTVLAVLLADQRVICLADVFENNSKALRKLLRTHIESA